MPLPVFPANGSFPRCLPSLHRLPLSAVRRFHRYYEGTTTSCPRFRRHLLVSFRRPTIYPVRVRIAALSVAGGLHRAGFPWSAGKPTPGALLRGRKTGPLRFAGDPSHAFAKLHDPGRTDQASPLSASSMLPPPRGKRRLRRSGGFRGLPLGFDIHCLRFTSAVADTHAKLVSGWLAGLCRERVELPGSLRRFPITS